jgi:hypothetical protein
MKHVYNLKDTFLGHWMQLSDAVQRNTDLIFLYTLKPSVELVYRQNVTGTALLPVGVARYSACERVAK